MQKSEVTFQKILFGKMTGLSFQTGTSDLKIFLKLPDKSASLMVSQGRILVVFVGPVKGDWLWFIMFIL